MAIKSTEILFLQQTFHYVQNGSYYNILPAHITTTSGLGLAVKWLQ